MQVPVAIFFYRRRKLVEDLLTILEKHRPPRLWLIADGPKERHEKEFTDHARGVALKRITWRCEVKTVFSETNLGCKNRLESGLDEFFRHEEEGIILEEDCHPSPDFFPFCEEMLRRYRSEKLVGGVSGDCFLPENQLVTTDYFFSKYCPIWGWATWARVWNSYDRSLWSWPQGGYREIFPDAEKSEEQFWNRVFRQVESGKISTWDYPWTAWLWNQKYVSIHPTQNLVNNVGFGTGATHTRDPSIERGIQREGRLIPPFRGPSAIQRDNALDLALFRNVFLRMEGRRGLWRKIADRCRDLLTK